MRPDISSRADVRLRSVNASTAGSLEPEEPGPNLSLALEFDRAPRLEDELALKPLVKVSERNTPTPAGRAVSPSTERQRRSCVGDRSGMFTELDFLADPDGQCDLYLTPPKG